MISDLIAEYGYLTNTGRCIRLFDMFKFFQDKKENELRTTIHCEIFTRIDWKQPATVSFANCPRCGSEAGVNPNPVPVPEPFRLASNWISANVCKKDSTHVWYPNSDELVGTEHLEWRDGNEARPIFAFWMGSQIFEERIQRAADMVVEMHSKHAAESLKQQKYLSLAIPSTRIDNGIPFPPVRQSKPSTS